LFLEYFLGFDKTQVDEVIEKVGEEPNLELPVTKEEDDEMKKDKPKDKTKNSE
jgi:hypothetical protein